MNSLQNADAKQPENRFVLDASALLASILREPGADLINGAMRAGACASTVNEAEVLSRLIDLGLRQDTAEAAVNELAYVAIDFSSEQAIASARLRGATSQFGLGLGDRSCLALGLSLGLPVLTADRIWSELNVGVEIVLCR